jgi:hypothetical protein
MEQPTASQLLDEVEAAVKTGNYQRFLAVADASRLALWMQHSTEGYSTPAAEDDRELVEREREVLGPVAEALMASPATGWWTSSCARRDQHFVDLGPDARWPSPPLLRPAAALDAGIAEEDDDERQLRADDQLTFPPPDHTAYMGQLAWSTPTTAWSTTRSVPGSLPLPALGLVREWSGEGPNRAKRYWSATVDGDARIYEIDSADAWVRLVERYPRDVTFTRSTWWQHTRWPGPWLLPDWGRVRADFDAVHLSVVGFLEAATIVLPVGEARTALSMWEPDGTYWLNDVITLGEAQAWQRADPRVDIYADMVIGDDGSLRIEPGHQHLTLMSPGRRQAVLDLVQLRTPIPEAINALSEFPGGSPGYVQITAADLERAVNAFENGSLSAADLTAWAATVHEREDIDFDGPNGPAIWQILFETGTPDLHGPLDPRRVGQWRQLLRATDPNQR